MQHKSINQDVDNYPSQSNFVYDNVESEQRPLIAPTEKHGSHHGSFDLAKDRFEKVSADFDCTQFWKIFHQGWVVCTCRRFCI